MKTRTILAILGSLGILLFFPSMLKDSAVKYGHASVTYFCILFSIIVAASTLLLVTISGIAKSLFSKRNT